MSLRNPPLAILVLALVLAPVAAAQEEGAHEALAWLDDVWDARAPDEAQDAAGSEPFVSVSEVRLLPPPSREEPAPESSSEPPSEDSASRPAPEERADAQPEESSRGGQGGLFGATLDSLGLPALAPLSSALAPVLGATDLPASLLPAEDAPVTAAAAPSRTAGAPSSPAPLAEAAPVAAGPSAALVAFASAAAVASVAAAPGFDWDRVRRFGFAAALYTRIAKDRLLDHGRRETLLGAIRDRPGMTLSDVAEASGIPRNTATYHLNRLEKEGIITSSRQGRTRLYFVVGGEARKTQADAFAALRHGKGRALALAVGEAPGLDQQALCAKLGLAPSLVHWHADRLLAAGVLRKEREGRHVRYHPGPAYPLVAASEAAPSATASGGLPC